MGWPRQAWIGLLGQVAWRLPSGPLRLMTQFSQAERGSYYDMLVAAELTGRRDLRRRYLEHALDEGRHAGLFLGRVQALGGADRTLAVLSDAAYLADAGIQGHETLFERLGELQFLAFVHVAEADAVEQFQTYLRLGLPDAETAQMLRTILKDEAFHVSYSRAALEPYRLQGRQDEVRHALRTARRHRLLERWKAGAHHLGAVVSTLWLGLFYLVAVGPFSLIERRSPGGWQAPQPDPRPLAAAARSPA